MKSISYVMIPNKLLEIIISSLIYKKIINFLIEEIILEECDIYNYFTWNWFPNMCNNIGNGVLILYMLVNVLIYIYMLIFDIFILLWCIMIIVLMVVF